MSNALVMAYGSLVRQSSVLVGKNKTRVVVLLLHFICYSNIKVKAVVGLSGWNEEI